MALLDQEHMNGGDCVKKEKRKYRKSSPWKKIVKKLDDVFSLFVRADSRNKYDGCPFCGKPIECCFHFVTRSKHSVRWDTRNAVGSCFGCNGKYEHDPHFAITWYMDNFGKIAYTKLILKGNIIVKRNVEDLQKLKNKFDKKLKMMNYD